jgi:hypothetical protein
VVEGDSRTQQKRITKPQAGTWSQLNWLRRMLNARVHLCSVLTQRPFVAGSLPNESVALGARHRTWPNDAGSDIWNLSKNGIVSVAVHDGLPEVLMQRSFPACQEPCAEQNPVRPERKCCREAAAVGDASGSEDRHRRDRINNHRR